MLKLILFSTKVQHTCTSLGIDRPHQWILCYSEYLPVNRISRICIYILYTSIIIMGAILNERYFTWYNFHHREDLTWKKLTRPSIETPVLSAQNYVIVWFYSKLRSYGIRMGRGVRFPGTIEETCSSQGFLSNENKTALYATGWVLGHWTNLAKPRKTKREFNNFDWYGQKEDGRFSEINFNQVFDEFVAKNDARI